MKTLKGGWKVASAEDIEKHREAFVSSYNKFKGLRVLKIFSSGNCCIALKGDDNSL
jgi:hypothetical protein